MGSPAHVVLLAAGAGSRFGGTGHKLAQPLGEWTVLVRSLRQVLASQLPLVVVTTAALAPLVRPWVAGQDIIELAEVGTPGLRLGMGRSIAAGVLARPQAPGWVVLPADMPLVQAGTLQRVAAALGETPVAYAQYRGRRGHPVGFAAELYSELVQLNGDDGARRVVARYPSTAVEVDDPGVLLDVDTPDDLVTMQQWVRSGPPAAA